MLDLIPFARARRQMTYIDRQTDCVRQTLQPQFPHASSGISANQQFPCFRIRLRAHMLPPRQNAIDGKVCGIVINPDAHPTAVACHIIHAIRNNLAQFFILKIISNVRLRFCIENVFSGHFIAVRVRRHVLKLSRFIFDFAA